MFIGFCSSKLVIYINLWPFKAQRILWKGDGKNVRILEKSWEVIIYGLDMVLAQSNSQHLCYDLHRPSQDQDTLHFSIDGEEVHESWSLLEELLAVTVTEGKRVTHLWGCGHGRRLVPQWMTAHPCTYGKYKLDSEVINNNKKEDMELGGR